MLGLEPGESSTVTGARRATGTLLVGRDDLYTYEETTAGIVTRLS